MCNLHGQVYDLLDYAHVFTAESDQMRDMKVGSGTLLIPLLGEACGGSYFKVEYFNIPLVRSLLYSDGFFVSILHMRRDGWTLFLSVF